MPHSHDHHEHDAHEGHTHGGYAHAGHSHTPANFGRAFAIGIALNLGFVVVEVSYGLVANSMALLADAGHNLGDVLGLVLAWVATVLARRRPSATHTYGMRRGTILSALANAVLLLVAIGGIAVEGVRRLIHPAEVEGVTVIVVATAGIVVNGVTAWLFASGRKGDINVRGAFLHMAYDALISLGVVLAGGVILLTGWTRLDPLVSLAVGGFILAGTWSLLRDSMALAMDAVPASVKLEEVRAFLKQQKGVTDLHDLHVWPMSTTETALTCHLVMPGGHPGDSFFLETALELKEHFGISHATMQVETEISSACELKPDHLV
ncbi:MAG: cation transporter [Ramlibacter sp.]|nr:cation transporter [Ramlibacter sp.]